jgi:hypothetical protein
MATFRDQTNGTVFKMDLSSYTDCVSGEKRVCLWDVHYEQRTVHMNRAEALRMVKTLLDFVEEIDGQSWTVTSPF